MCGIGAMLGCVDSAVLSRINQLQSHRGPDGARVWFDDHCGLAHARLAILDLAGSDQPLASDHGAVLVHNGEIYNHQRVRRRYPNYPWRTAGDSETILALHSRLGRRPRTVLSSPEVRSKAGMLVTRGHSASGNPAQRHREWVSRLDGIWGFALWDAAANELVLSRDPFGVKPLIRSIVCGSLLVTSELKALRAHEGYLPTLDRTALIARLAYEYPLDQTTLVEQATQVAPGSIETWSLDEAGRPVLTGIDIYERRLNRIDAAWEPDSGLPALLQSFKSSLTDRLMSDVPVGIVLSGGLDSSLVAALAHDAAEAADKPVPECWTVADSRDNPDWLAAAEVTERFDLVHHQHLLDTDSFDNTLPALAWHGEDLDVTVLFFQPLFERMSQHVKVGLCGQGADELHAGYPRYSDLRSHADLVQRRLALCDLPEAVALTSDLPADDVGPARRWSRSSHSPPAAFSGLIDCLDFELQHGQLTNFQLRLVDRHSMAHGLEVRVPFLGSAHWEQSRRLPVEWRLPRAGAHGSEKRALRAIARQTDLPPSITERPKLPAGRATSPTLVRTFLDEHQSQMDLMLERYVEFAGLLRGQEELALGLGMFEALHLNDGGERSSRGTVDDVLSVLD